MNDVNALSAIRLSLQAALWSTAAALPVALFLGWLLARKNFPGKSLLSGLVLCPLVLPPVVTGLLLLDLFGRNSFFGAILAEIGIQVPFSLVGASLAALITGLPLFVGSIRASLEAVDRRYEEVAMTLGENPPRAFARVTLPLALPGILAGAVLAFARGLGEFGATAVLAGNIEGRTRTVSLAVYSLLENPAGGPLLWKLTLASVGLSLLALVFYEFLNRRLRRRLEA